VTNALRHAVHDAGDDHAAVAVAGEHDIVEILEEDEVDHIHDVGLEVDVGAVEVHPFAEAGERDTVDRVTVVGQEPAGLLPFPCAGGGTVDDHVGVFLRGSRSGTHPCEQAHGGRQDGRSNVSHVEEW
jgi:hypothetical protein